MSASNTISDNNLIAFLQLAIRSIAFTSLWIPVYTLRCLLASFIPLVRKNYGKMLNYHDSGLIEDFTEERPKSTIAFTLTLDGDLELKEFQQLFTRNVLEARLFNKDKTKDELRYPELKQYQVEFAGFQFWRNDTTFHIDNHITEVLYERKFKTISAIHKNLLNKLYSKRRSPWEIVLIRNSDKSNKTLIIYRSHHSLGGTIAVLKVLVECLGGKALKLPNTQFKGNSSLLEKVLFYVLLPFYFVLVQLQGHLLALRSKNNPWYFNGKETGLVNVDISQEILMDDLKSIAKKNDVTTSSVILSIIAGAIGKYEPRLRRRNLPCEYILPKPDHPETLTNHCYIGAVNLPTDITSPVVRLRKCNENFLKLRFSLMPKYADYLKFQVGTWFNPLRAAFTKNNKYPIIITNIAGDTEGFDVSGCACSEITMTCGPLQGVGGVLICAFSYKDSIKVSVTAKEGILDYKQIKQLVEFIDKEFENLKKLSF